MHFCREIFLEAVALVPLVYVSEKAIFAKHRVNAVVLDKLWPLARPVEGKMKPVRRRVEMRRPHRKGSLAPRNKNRGSW